MADKASDEFHHHEDGVEAHRNGESLAMADTMMVMPVAVAMPVMVAVSMAMTVPVSVMMIAIMVIVPMIMGVIMVAMSVLMRVSGGVARGGVAVIMSHRGSFRGCCVAQMSQCSRIRAFQDRRGGGVWTSWQLIRARCLQR
jgi:hypothetical protein